MPSQSKKQILFFGSSMTSVALFRSSIIGCESPFTSCRVTWTTDDVFVKKKNVPVTYWFDPQVLLPSDTPRNVLEVLPSSFSALKNALAFEFRANPAAENPAVARGEPSAFRLSFK